MSASRPDADFSRRVASALRVANASHSPVAASAPSTAPITTAAPAARARDRERRAGRESHAAGDTQDPSGHVGLSHQKGGSDQEESHTGFDHLAPHRMVRLRPRLRGKSGGSSLQCPRLRSTGRNGVTRRDLIRFSGAGAAGAAALAAAGCDLSDSDDATRRCSGSSSARASR